MTNPVNITAIVEQDARLFELGTVYRYEKSGVVHGLTRVRGLTQDDSHSYCTPEQAPEEVEHLLNFVLGLLRDFGIDDFYLELSTRDDSKPDKFIGSDDDWAVATAVLEKVEALGITLFDRIDSRDHTAITGLPLLQLSAELRRLGFAMP